MRRPARAAKCGSRVAHRPAAWTSGARTVGQDAGHRTLVGGCGGICWACACTRIGSFGAHWRGAGAGDHRPGRNAATCRSCGAQGALRSGKARETGGFRAGADRPTGPRRQGARESVCGATTVVAHLAHSYRRLTGARVSPVADCRSAAPPPRRQRATLRGPRGPVAGVGRLLPDDGAPG